MRKIHLYVIAISMFVIVITSCKKGYTCACTSSTGYYDGFDIHESKAKAEKKCDNYYNSNYKNKVVNDSLSNTGNVECELQKGE